jgi:hypothetical protein
MDTHIRETKPGSRHLNLTKSERTELATQQQIERVVVMFLDLEQDRTWKQIAEEAGMTFSQLKKLVNRPEFQKVYDEATVAIGHDPRLRAITTALPNLLPLAYRRLTNILADESVRPDITLKAINDVMRLNHVGEEKEFGDPREMKNFLQQNNVKLEGDMIVNLNVPKEFQDAFRKFTNKEVLEASIRPVQQEVLPPTTPQTAEQIAALSPEERAAMHLPTG